MKSHILRYKGSLNMPAGKKMLLIVAFFATVLVQHSFAQDTSSQAQLSQLLHSYYGIKNALVAGDGNTAAMKAEEFVTTANGIDTKVLPESTRNALLKNAGNIAATKDINHQREHFADLSSDMSALAKSVKLTSQPVYQQYCPMKKSYWLSADKAIKNPYFGNAMLTCGKVVETIQ